MYSIPLRLTIIHIDRVLLLFSKATRTCFDLLKKGYRVFLGGKVRPGRAVDHSPPSSAAVMEG